MSGNRVIKSNVRSSPKSRIRTVAEPSVVAISKPRAKRRSPWEAFDESVHPGTPGNGWSYLRLNVEANGRLAPPRSGRTMESREGYGRGRDQSASLISVTTTCRWTHHPGRRSFDCYVPWHFHAEGPTLP